MSFDHADAFLSYLLDRCVEGFDWTADVDRYGAGILVVAAAGQKGSAGSLRDDDMPPRQRELSAEEAQLDTFGRESPVYEEDDDLASSKSFDQSADSPVRRVDMYSPYGSTAAEELCHPCRRMLTRDGVERITLRGEVST